MRHSTRIVVETLWVGVYAGSLFCGLRFKGKKSFVFLAIAALLAAATLAFFAYVFWLLRDGWTPPSDGQGNYIRSKGLEAVEKAYGAALTSPPIWGLILLVILPAVLHLVTRARHK